jgi:hypothetical protein
MPFNLWDLNVREPIFTKYKINYHKKGKKKKRVGTQSLLYNYSEGYSKKLLRNFSDIL